MPEERFDWWVVMEECLFASRSAGQDSWVLCLCNAKDQGEAMGSDQLAQRFVK
jgi:hypothetical protein